MSATTGIVVHPGTGESTLTLVPDATKFTVAFSGERDPLSREAQSMLRDRAAPIAQFPRYGITVYDGPSTGARDNAVDVLNRERSVEIAAPVMHRHTADGDEVYVTRNVLVQFWPEVTRERIDELLGSLQGQVQRPLDYADNGFLVLAAPDTDGLGAVHLANALRETGLTKFAHPDLVSKRHRRGVGTVERAATGLRAERDGDLVSQQWHLVNSRATDAWTLTTGESAIWIAILDDGVDLTHPEFDGRVVAQWDFTDDVEDGNPKTEDDKHGTACAGVAAARGLHASGVAPGCSLMAVRFPAALGDSDEAEMFRWASDNGADVISCSWGPTDGTGQTDALPGSTQAAIQYCLTQGRQGKGIVVCWAAGNGNESVDVDGYAANPHVVAVAACNDRNERSWYSDMGDALWVTAPSSGDRAAGEKAITTTDRQGGAGYNDGSEGVAADYTDSFGGTSSATPLVAGVVGLMLSANPDLTPLDIRTILRDTARKIGSGYDANGHSTDFGYGLVDAYEAVRGAQAAQGQAPVSSGVATITGPSSVDRNGPAPTFDVDPGGGLAGWYAVEVGTRAELLDGGDHGTDDGFYASWQDSAFQNSTTWTLPDAAWQRMSSSDTLYYRAWFSSSADSWQDVVVTTDDADFAQAPSMSIDDGGGTRSSRKRRETAAEAPQAPSTPTTPTITGPSSCERGGPAPSFDLAPAPGSTSTYYAVEVATDPMLFDSAEHTLGDGFFASWSQAPFLSERHYQLPDDAWRALSSAEALHYRAWFSSSPSGWVDVLVTTPDRNPMAAPRMRVTAPTASRSRTVGAARRVPHPTITGPTEARRGGDAPVFTVTLPVGVRSWMLECCTDPMMFGTTGAADRTDTTFVASEVQPATTRTIALSGAGWATLQGSDQIYYRVASSPADPSAAWYPQDWSVAPSLPEAAPWIEILQAARPRTADVGPTRVSDPDEHLWRG